MMKVNHALRKRIVHQTQYDAIIQRNVYHNSMHVMEIMTVVIIPMKMLRWISLLYYHKFDSYSSITVLLLMIIKLSARWSLKNNKWIVCMRILYVKYFSIAKMVKYQFVHQENFNVIIIDAYLNNGNVIQTMIVVMDLMKN